MRRVIYISVSRIVDDPAELRSIVEASAIRNEMNGITGMLWTDGFGFAQVLEGAHAVVGETFDRIRADRRHEDVQIVCDREVTGPMFGRWSMRRPDASQEATTSEAFLIGYAKRMGGPAARRLLEIVVADNVPRES